VREALKFAGPMPFTFDYEKETNSIIRVEGVRANWQPRSVAVNVQKLTYFDQKQFAGVAPIHCSSFFLTDIPYYWKEGICEELDPETSESEPRYYSSKKLDDVDDYE
jgi:hypothetical protein